MAKGHIHRSHGQRPYNRRSLAWCSRDSDAEECIRGIGVPSSQVVR